MQGYHFLLTAVGHEGKGLEEPFLGGLEMRCQTQARAVVPQSHIHLLFHLPA